MALDRWRFPAYLGPMSYPADESGPRVHRWTYTAEADEVALVLPDGCIDILVSWSDRIGHALIGVTDLDFAPRQVKLPAGTSLIGYRLRPGATIRLDDVQFGRDDLCGLEAEIDDRVSYDQEASEIIDILGLPDSSVEWAARQQGVSERSLQRHFRKLSLPSPAFWRQLGRARRAVQALPCRAPIAEIALEYGYSDQAHMTREFVRWFGWTPAQLRQQSGAMNDLAQPGLGNW
ncbi:AraC family transcriptional regulator [Martelella mediterranea]|uniref:AraC family transcriptional regulator n=1 Tax=Martelella mediterranea TaxID=293089 RepID=UPI001E51D23F|nr:AraC family transcriptional regulator [Martelella mediterranea]MCD1632547.1 AraC family transcriptional regulator [Martelella mediterranea]